MSTLYGNAARKSFEQMDLITIRGEGKRNHQVRTIKNLRQQPLKMKVSEKYCKSLNFLQYFVDRIPGSNPMNSSQACIYKRVNTSVF